MRPTRPTRSFLLVRVTHGTRAAANGASRGTTTSAIAPIARMNWIGPAALAVLSQRKMLRQAPGSGRVWQIGQGGSGRDLAMTSEQAILGLGLNTSALTCQVQLLWSFCCFCTWFS